MNKLHNTFRRRLRPLLWGGLATVSALHFSARAETFLPVQDVTITGRVTVPSCTVRLDTGHLRFEKGGSGNDAQQYQHLTFGQCDLEGVDVQFQAGTWAGYPDRGTMKSKTTRQPSSAWYFQVAPTPPESDDASPDLTGAPLSLSNTSDLVGGSTPPGERHSGGCFRLQGGRYHYEVSPETQGSAVHVIPLTVSVHNLPGSAGDAGDLDAAFSLSLTYR